MYFYKLNHIASKKISARSIGSYTQKTLQPPRGRSKNGGHRFGEMEVWALLGHDAENYLRDMLTVQSDSIGRKQKLISEILDNPDLFEEDTDVRPQTVKLLDSYLSVFGLNIFMKDV
jgi:DNA-directed RNA polymerase subunit beta